MKKRLLSLLLALALVVGLIPAFAMADDVFTLKMQIVTFGQEFPGLADVENAINAITEPEIGVRVELNPVAAWDLTSTSSLAITSDEQIDLMCILPMSSNLDSISNYSSKFMLEELDDLYAEYGQDIQEALGDLIKIGYSGGTLYAIPANYYAGHGLCFVAKTAELEALGYSFDEDTIYTLDDIEQVMAAYKAAKGDGYYAITGFADAPINLVATDDLGDPAIGSLMNCGLENTTVVNRYATEEYRQMYDRIRSWFLAGYINPDAISITDTWVSLLQTGHYLGSFIGCNASGLDGIIVNEQSLGEGLTVIRYCEDFATTSAASYSLWAIPVTSGNPEKTMQFLNILYQKRDLSNSVAALLSAGIEGVTYKVVEDLGDGRVIIDYADGVTRMTAPYAGQVPIYGDELRTPKYTPIDAAMFEEISNYNSTLKYSKAFGYSFDSQRYVSKISAINNVLKTYEAQLGFGTVDVDTVLPQFLAELEAAGINDVIAANQEQLDSWLAAQN